GLPLTEAESLVCQFWEERPPKSGARVLVGRLRERVRQEDWAGAVRACDQLTPLLPRRRKGEAAELPWEWQVAVGELQLYALRPQVATRRFERVLRTVRPQRSPFYRGSIARQAASYAMARARSEAGRFEDAITWLKRAPDEFDSGCGTCLA